ncbi:acyltransferase [Candidatus Nomurabacteria bacterium]|nr:acyltransferase [Candidatus Nomurabacteria bacterium]
MKKILRFFRLKFIGRITWLRNVYWRNIFKSFGSGSCVNGKILVKTPHNISIGGNVNIDHGCVLNARDSITIGDNVSISVNVIINTGGLNYINTGKERRVHVSSPVTIEDGVWLASGSIVNAGVTIGENSVVAAGAVVTKDVPAGVVVAGIPAKIIKEIPVNT